MKNSKLVFFLCLLLIVPYCHPAHVFATGQEQKATQQGNPVVEQEGKISVPFITLRNRTGKTDPSSFYGGNRGSLEAGFCTVEVSPIWGLVEIALTVPFYIPGENIDLVGLQQASLKELEAAHKNSTAKGNGNLTLYIHGYNIDFEKSCRRSALLKRALGISEGLLLFSWPADGNMLKYTWDESDLLWSVPHLAKFLEQAVVVTGDEHVNVIAHSLGARGIVQALVRLSYRNLNRIMLNELVLIAPDIDTDLFRQDLGHLQNVAKRITVYVSKKDKALKLSEEVHGYSRLGQAGHHLSLFKEVETIDISQINTRRFSGHIYHIFNPEVISDLSELLTTGKSAAQRTHLKAAWKKDQQYWLLQSRDE